MRLIHTADLHLESKMESNLSKEQATRRRGELISAFEQIINYAGTNDVRLVLISGDMFDKSNIRKSAMRTVIDLIKANPDMDFLYLRGNHDCEAFDAELNSSYPPNFYTFDSEKWTRYEYDDIVITGREINDDNQNNIYGDLVLDVAKFNIVMLHGQESVVKPGDRTHIINIKALRNKYIDYLALGHIHSYKLEKLDERGMYCYPGCPEPRGFDECGTKGFVVLDIDDKTLKTEFVSLQKRTFHEVELSVDPGMDMPRVYSAVEDILNEIPAKDLVKLVITGFTELDRDIDTERICDKFADRVFFFKVYDRTRAKIDYESFAFDRTLKGTFVRTVQGLEIPEGDKSDIIETGIKAIMGEDLS